MEQTRVVGWTTHFSDLPSCLVMNILSRLPITILVAKIKRVALTIALMEEAKPTSVITTVDVDGTTQFSDLPSCLVMDILSRLPIATLVTCRCVCKDWIRLFQEPYFIKLQLAASPVHILNQSIWKEDVILQFGEFMEDNGNGDIDLKILNLPTKVDLRTLLNLRRSTSLYGFQCMNSCNGLLSLVGNECTLPLARSVCVCNPILGEWVSISTPVRNYFYLSSNIPLVFSAKNNQYKLLHCFKTEEEGYGFEIYTLGGGTRQWRSIHETLGCRPWRSIHETLGCRPWRSIEDSYTLLHGSLHWINDPHMADFICCFDVDNEKFRRLSLPRREGKSSNALQLGVINGCLCALFSDWIPPVEIWCMKEYGVEESWAMIHTFEVSGRLLFSLNEDEFLMRDWEGLISYNLKTERCRRQKMSYNYFDIAYKPSFISLQDVVARGEEVILSR